MSTIDLPGTAQADVAQVLAVLARLPAAGPQPEGRPAWFGAAVRLTAVLRGSGWDDHGVLDTFAQACTPEGQAQATPTKAATIYELCTHPECGRFVDGAGWSCRAARDHACAALHAESEAARARSTAP